MPVAAKCPSCSAPLSETSVLALAPVCHHCGSVITEVGGTLGLTGAYGVNDPTITRQRVAADLSVFESHLNNSRGMLASCREQMKWDVDRYACFPPEPELLALKYVPPSDRMFLEALKIGGYWLLSMLFLGFVCATLFAIGSILYDILQSNAHIPSEERRQKINAAGDLLTGIFALSVFPGSVLAALISQVPHFATMYANGTKPMENARRADAHQRAVGAALKAAEPVKAAADHRLRVQIRELEGLIKTLSEKQQSVRRILGNL